MKLKVLNVIQANDEAGVAVMPLALEKTLRELDLISWPGRKKAIEEIEDVRDAIGFSFRFPPSEQDRMDDNTIACWLLLARSTDDQLPTLGYVEARIVEA